MGLIFNRVKFLLDGKDSGSCFDNTIMVGRQKLSLSVKENNILISTYNLSNQFDKSYFEKRGYSDDIIKSYLEIKNLRIVDYSDYEGADIVTDLNHPIKKELYNNFDALIDGGSIEHIFNFPNAIKNYMKMVKVGGSIFIFTNANNHCGHGFYQFSPELFFNIFNESNGFKTSSILLMEHPYPGAELSKKQVSYEVIDPGQLGERSVIVNNKPLGIMICAKKIKETEIFKDFPIQNDYANLNNKYFTKEKLKQKISNLDFIKDVIPNKILNTLRGMKQLKKYSLKNRKFFLKVD